jgi:hypothetical protein
MKNNNNKPLNSLIDINKKIIPFFSSPVILKRISDQKKNIDSKSLNPQKKLIYKIIKLNEKLVKFSTSMKNYNLDLDSFFLSQVGNKNEKLSPTKNLGKGGRNNSEFILFVRNNLYYNLKLRWSNILYKILKLIPVLKTHSLLNNINLFAPKRLFKPQPYIRYFFRIIKIRPSVGSSDSSPSLAQDKGKKDLKFQPAIPAEQGGKVAPQLKASAIWKTSSAIQNFKRLMRIEPQLPALRRKRLIIKINYYNKNNSSGFAPKGRGSMLISPLQLNKFENGRSIKYILNTLNVLLNEIDNIILIKNIMIKIAAARQSAADNFNTLKNQHLLQTGSSFQPLTAAPQKDQVVDQSNKLDSNSFNTALAKPQQQDSSCGLSTHPDSVKYLRLKIKKINSSSTWQAVPAPQCKAGGVSPLSLNLNINKDEEIFPLSDQGMVKENLIKIAAQRSFLSNSKQLKDIQSKSVENNSASPLGPLGGEQSSNYGSLSFGEKDIIDENSNPVDLLYFNNNRNKPIINQYIKSMSTYNMITNGTILYYSNIIGFDFKKRIRTFLPFVKAVKDIQLISPAAVGHQSHKGREDSMSNLQLETTVCEGIKGGERLTSPYSIRGLRKVVGSLDRYKRQKFSIFGRGLENNKLINNINKFLYLSFRSMYCLISKPVFMVKSNKIIIQLFYFLLIPKILKNIRSKKTRKTNYLLYQKKQKLKNLSKLKADKRITQAFASLYEGKLKVRKDAHVENYFAQDSLLPLNDQQNYNNFTAAASQPEQHFVDLLHSPEGSVAAEKGVKDVRWLHPTKGVYDFVKNHNNNSNTSIMSLDQKSAKLLAKTYFNELNEIRKNEEKIRGVEFNKLGQAKIKSVENKRSTFSNNKVVGGDSAGRVLQRSPLRDGQKKRFYRSFLKRFDFNNMINNLHIVRLPKKLCSYPSNLRNRGNNFAGLRDKNAAGNIMDRKTINSFKLFKYLALTYFNIFKFKSRRHPLNKIKFRLNWFFNKMLIKNYSNLNNKDITRSALRMKQLLLTAGGRRQGGIKKSNSWKRNRDNIKIHYGLFNKLLNSIRLSKLIIPNAKILQKLGIPKWRWPYSGLNKKGYPKLNKYHLSQPLMGDSGKVQSTAMQSPIFSYSWPFSLLFCQPNTLLRKVDLNNKVNYSSNIEADSLIKHNLKEGAGGANHKFILRHQEGLIGGEVQKPVLKKRNPNKFTELYTRRHLLMKLANINLIKIFPLKFEKLCEVLNSIFNKPVELDLIRIHYPYNDSNILVRLLAFMINKMKFRRITRRLFNKAVVKSIKKVNNKDQVNIIPAFISGITIRVAGRLMKYRVVPRKTVKIFRRGSSSIGKINYSDISRFTNKNKRGAFTITVKSGHNFFN